MTKVAESFRVGHNHVDISLHWPHVSYDLNHIDDKYRKRGRVHLARKKRF